MLISSVNKNWSKVKQEKIPTKILIGDTWLKTSVNPGLHLRSQYRQDFYQHAQSWRAIPSMENSGDAYYKKAQGGWQSCDVPSHQCVSRYPVDGNLDLLPALYPPSNDYWEHVVCIIAVMNPTYDIGHLIISHRLCIGKYANGFRLFERLWNILL